MRSSLLKGAEQNEIVRAIRAVAAGEAIFGPAVARLVIQHFASGSNALSYLGIDSWLPWVAASAVFFLATGLGGLRNAVLPKWLAVATVVLGICCLLGPTGIAVWFATPVWLAVTGIALAQRQTVRAESLVPTHV
jgi:hypothetical protein